MIWYIFPAVGGPGLGRYWRGYHLARAWQNGGADPIVIGPGYHHYFLRRKAMVGTHLIDGVTHYFIPTRPYGNHALSRLRAILTFGIGLLSDVGLAEMAASRSPDVVVYSSPYPFGYPAAHRLARRHRAALVFEVRDVWPLTLTRRPRARTLAPIRARCRRLRAHGLRHGGSCRFVASQRGCPYGEAGP